MNSLDRVAHSSQSCACIKWKPKQRAICDQLYREAIAPAANEMGVARRTLRDAVIKIRSIFRDAGLEEFL